MVDIFLLLPLAAALFTSFQTLSLRIGTDAGRSKDALFVVLLVNILIFVPFAVVSYYPVYDLTLVSVLSFAAAGLVGTMLGRAFYYAGIERAGASRSEPIKATMPLHATIVSVLVLQETLTFEIAIGILLIVSGTIYLSWETSKTEFDRLLDSVDSRDLAIPFIGAFFYGVEPVFAKIGIAEGTPIFIGLAIKTLTATIGFFAYLRWRRSIEFGSLFNDLNLKWYVAAGLLNTSVLLTYYSALAELPVIIVIPIMQTSPLIVILLSFLFLRRLEVVTRRLVVGASLVVIGAIVITVVA